MNKTINNKEVDRKSNVQFLHTANSDSMNKIIQGDCLEKLKELEDNSVDSIVTDPPYELGFMGKKWDNSGIAYNVDMWAECLRVLKPGGHLLAFGGTRTYHRMAVAIEDAGFEVRDMIEWVYGSGFPKSLNIGKSVNQLETSEWSKIGKALDNIENKSIMEIWKSNSNNVKIVETQSLKNQTIAGQDMPSENFVVLNVVQNSSQENSNLLVSFAEQNLSEAQAINTKINTVLPSVEAEIRQLQNNVKSAEQQSQNQSHKSWSIFTAQCDVKEWLKENTMVSLKVDEALKTLRGKKKYSNEEITNVLCAVIPSVLKHTILNQSKTFQNLDTNQKMECVSAINVIITEYIMDNLISNTVAILKSKAVDKLQGNERVITGSEQKAKPTFHSQNVGGKITEIDNIQITKGTSEWEGWGTSLKPAHEPICMARKPLAEKTVAENCLKWGTGGINIDESRVSLAGEWDKGTMGTFRKAYDDPNKTYDGTKGNVKFGGDKLRANRDVVEKLGRFPANIILGADENGVHEEVRECFPETKSGTLNSGHKRGDGTGNSFMGGGGTVTGNYGGDSGNASRFFKSILYYPKASKSERNKGCEGLEEKEEVYPGINTFDESGNRLRADGSVIPPLKSKNNHPTVKPIALMEYLIKMITPKGGIVLDPFAGSGSTLVAAKQNGYKYIGIELTEEYIPIIEARLEAVKEIKLL